MRWALAATLAVSVTLVGNAAKVVDLFPQPFGVLRWEEPPYTDEFKRLTSQGQAAIKSGDVDKGIDLLTQAAKLRFPSAHPDDDPPPNFELWDDIAVAECKRSFDRSKALSLLQDYKCAVEMTVYDVSCYIGDLETQVPNARLTPLCFRTMCGGVWEPHSSKMGGASSDDPDGIAASLNELKRVNGLIKKCSQPNPLRGLDQENKRIDLPRQNLGSGE